MSVNPAIERSVLLQQASENCTKFWFTFFKNRAVKNAGDEKTDFCDNCRKSRALNG